MKSFKVLLVILVLGAVITVLPGCNTKSTAAPATTQTATVTRGNLTQEITAAGNLALSDTQDLAVDLFYPTGTKGTIGEVLVQAGDVVKKGQVLVTIDKTEWNDQLSLLQDQVTAKQRALVQAQINLKNAQTAIITDNETILSRQSAVLSAEVSLTQAQNTLAGAITTVDFPPIAAAYNKAKTYYDYVTITMVAAGIKNQADWDMALQNAQEALDTATTNYDNALSGYTSADITLKKKQAEIAQNALTAAKQAVIDAQNDVPLKQLNLTLVQGQLQDAQKALQDAENNVTDAQSKSPEIIAPFDGFITAVNVAGGDQVLNGTIAATIADPNKFETDILVSEMNILSLTIGTNGTLAAQSISGVSFPVKVTYIAPTATIASSVVNYSVKVALTSLTPIVTTTASSFIPPSGNFTLPKGFTPPSGNFTRPSSGNSSANKARIQDFLAKQGAAANSAKQYTLKSGMTVTVTLEIPISTNVLIVPIAAVKTQGGQSYVVVSKTDGTTENRTVITGNSDDTNTEIVNGLTEGEKVVISSSISSSTKTTATASIPRGGGNIIFGGGTGR